VFLISFRGVLAGAESSEAWGRLVGPVSLLSCLVRSPSLSLESSHASLLLLLYYCTPADGG
jgi:hypothetical protein